MEISGTPDVLYRIKRGLAGYISYLAACEMNAAFSEYVLYEPILRILTARGYTVSFEVECPGVQQPRRGDRRRLDLEARKEDTRFAMEVKWAKTSTPDLKRDLEKLKGYVVERAGAESFLCVFGRRSHISGLKITALIESGWKLEESGTPVFADFGRTRYGCRIFRFSRRSS